MEFVSNLARMFQTEIRPKFVSILERVDEALLICLNNLHFLSVCLGDCGTQITINAA